MELEIALDELYATGWSGLDTAGCAYAADGRSYPSVERVRREFAAAGLEVSIDRVEPFGCYRSEWSLPAAHPADSVVASSADEAAVYALARMRRELVVA